MFRLSIFILIVIAEIITMLVDVQRVDMKIHTKQGGTYELAEYQ